MRIPLAAWDLRHIAAALEPLELLPALRHPVIGRIEVLQPEGDGEVIGYFQQEGEDDDAWYGFVPKP